MKKLSSYQKLKAENENLYRDLLSLVKDYNSAESLFVRAAIELKINLEEAVFFGDRDPIIFEDGKFETSDPETINLLKGFKGCHTAEDPNNCDKNIIGLSIEFDDKSKNLVFKDNTTPIIQVGTEPFPSSTAEDPNSKESWKEKTDKETIKYIKDQREKFNNLPEEDFRRQYPLRPDECFPSKNESSAIEEIIKPSR